MKMGFGVKVDGFMSSPTEAFSGSIGGSLEGVREETLRAPLKYTLTWLLILGAVFGLGSLVFSLVMAGTMGFTMGLPGLGLLAGPALAIVPITIGVMVGAGIISLLIGSAWIHLWVYVLRGKAGYVQTLKAVAYGATPSYIGGVASAVLLLIPWVGGVIASIVGVVASVWALVVGIIGVRELHSITTGRAVAAYALAFSPILLLAILI